jgi:hypothetical protein
LTHGKSKVGKALIVKQELNVSIRRRNPTNNNAAILEIVRDILSNKKTELIVSYLTPESSPVYTGVKVLESLFYSY